MERNPTTSPKSDSTGPLTGVRVIDLSRLVAGNMLSMQLADFGAEVIKVESAREGDTLRHWREDLGDGASLDAWWQVYGRNKKSLALDLRDPDAIGLLRRLAAGAQVLIESFRPGTLEAMGLAPASLHEFNRRLVIVRVSGWGQTGPYRDLPGFGSLLEGFCGFARKHAIDDVPRLPNMALADMVAGLAGAFATMAAVREVEVRGGQGQVVDLSLLEPMLAIMGPDVTAYAATGRIAGPSVKIASPRGVYQCKDGGWVALSGSTDAMARRVLQAIGRVDLAEEPRFATNAARLANDAELDALIADAVARLNRDECLAHLRAQGVTAGPIYDAAELAADSHVVDRACYVRPSGAGGTLMQNVMPRLANTPGRIRHGAPLLGEHTVQVLRDVGLDDVQIEELSARGAIKCI
ncbi:CoA transferase [Achromobacter mucicolens]|uniref:CaiB/BaiF CoA transferase family protein n=1 Tax=Achromobacter mucicolens TaxID=1389922 RepID=UPI0007C845F1|nr:CaiB/BaiF CoA-transferase family protein [Achromobacter mucicolens]OAE56787.1 acyl-CoA transferase [Achromobacter xylosoxidans]PTX06739.1 CoA transferase [Achromobacter mucicolens]